MEEARQHSAMKTKDSNDDHVVAMRRELAKDAIDRAFQAALELQKWVLTSIAVFHSAALIAGFNSQRFASLMFDGPAWAFLIGIGLAIGAGLALSVGAAEVAGLMTNALWRGEGLDTKINDVFDPEPTRPIILGSSLMGLSIAAFLIGIALAAVQISALPAPVENVEAKR